jgi:hypothetical protein
MFYYWKNLDLKSIIYFDSLGEEFLEEWRDVVGYEGLYRVSNLGRVKSCEKLCNYKKLGKRYISESILKSSINNEGYLLVGLHKNNIQTSHNVHILVAMAFLNHIPCGYDLVVDHKNFIRHDSRLFNLQIITQRENTDKKHLRSSSEYTGVFLIKGGNKKRWSASISFNSEHIYLGTFDNELEASLYYENAVLAIKNNKEIKIKLAVVSSKYKGVSWCKRDSKWLAQKTINGKYKFLGRFKNEEDAYKAYQEA